MTGSAIDETPAMVAVVKIIAKFQIFILDLQSLNFP
jgi:hypothetical protein